VTAEIDDDLWTAIGDPTRFRVLDLLVVTGSGTASSLARQLPVTRQAVAKHLAILERTGLVRSGAAGREVRYEVDPAQFARACAQLDSVSRAWDRRLLRIKTMAESVQRSLVDPSATRSTTNAGPPVSEP
jgi:ArsR family transcriptional regulator, cadmium/lead-responsive transcriptional repressor